MRSITNCYPSILSLLWYLDTNGAGRGVFLYHQCKMEKQPPRRGHGEWGKKENLSDTTQTIILRASPASEGTKINQGDGRRTKKRKKLKYGPDRNRLSIKGRRKAFTFELHYGENKK
ncbi:hypothetical protein CEXT_64981 [Caerostris extrusa]|uniref:Uncharacterized protein n=1 Tax=Caerostris extrusa TaxID=172846 RepID=A0AAV4N4G4_CAEEX|nr:hypothetical protein CEXT_64981 [Caerostris extrusa]